MQQGGISPSGRALRWLVWRAPVGATRYSVARNMSVVNEEGRWWLSLAAFGIWVAGFWYAATLLHNWLGVTVPLQLAGLFGLLLIWRIIGRLRRWVFQWRSMKAQAVSVKRAREMYEMQAQALALLRQGGAAGAGRVGEVFGMWGWARHHDPVQATLRQMEREQAEQVAQWLPPADEGFEPVFRVPRFLRRRRRKEPDDG